MTFGILLILTCTEVETLWRGVLIANSAANTTDRLTTSDYVKLTRPMQLGEYAVSFPNYPWLPAFKPYEGWGGTGKPTQELKWYDAYNAVKHDRVNKFERATLGSIFEAVSSCVVMMVAQFGLPAGLGDDPQLRSFFQLASVPVWPLSEVYIFPYGVGDWSPVDFKF